MGLQKCGLNLNRALKELQPHGTLEFPCAGFDSEYKSSGEKIIPWHWHEELEIIYIKEGGLRLQIPGKTVCLNKGEGYIINSNILHYAAAEPYCRLNSLVFHPLLITGGRDTVFSVRYLTPLMDCSAFDGCPLTGTARDNQEAADLFLSAFDAFSSGLVGYEFCVREKLSDICFLLCQRYQPDIDGGEKELDQDNIRIRNMLDYIHRHFEENLTLTQIAKAADVGERECLRCFQRVVQISPVQYLLKYRVMQGASLLLKNKNSSISEVSSQCGFDSPSNFSQMFKRFYKCSPKDYRKGEGK